jgi:hypothetical protein
MLHGISYVTPFNALLATAGDQSVKVRDCEQHTRRARDGRRDYNYSTYFYWP